MHLSEWPTLQRLDLSYSLPFFSACAGALIELGLCTELDSDGLRQSIKDYQRQRDVALRPLLVELLSQKNSIAARLEAHYGTAGLDMLLFRWTLAQAGEDLAAELWTLSEELIGKADLLFNQPFHVYENNECERRTLFSSFLVDVAAHTIDISEQLQATAQSLRVLYPAGSIGCKGEDLDRSIARHLGFSPEEMESLPALRLQNCIRQLQSEIQTFIALMETAFEQITHNSLKILEEQTMKILLEDMKGELAKLIATPMYAPTTLNSMENRRHRLLGTLLLIREGAHQVRLQFGTLLKTSAISKTEPWIWPLAERRYLLGDLLSRAVSIADANDAIVAIERYCQGHLISPEQLLGAELHQIHHLLDESSLKVLHKNSAEKGVGNSLNPEKQMVLGRKEKLLYSIQSKLGRSLIILVAVLTFPACGVKTTPHSDILDLRPSVSYHSDQRSKPKDLEKPLQAPAGLAPKEK